MKEQVPELTINRLSVYLRCLNTLDAAGVKTISSKALAEQFQQATRDPRRPYQGYPQDLGLDQAADPRQLGRMASRASREDPDLLEQLVGPNSPLNSTGAKLAMAGAAAYLASKYMNNQR